MSPKYGINFRKKLSSLEQVECEHSNKEMNRKIHNGGLLLAPALPYMCVHINVPISFIFMKKSEYSKMLKEKVEKAALIYLLEKRGGKGSEIEFD